MIFTALDSTVECVDLHDGRPVWKSPISKQEGDQYVAGVFDDKVLIVGKGYVRFHNVNNGQQVRDPLVTGIPTGIGVATAGTYFVPIKASLPATEEAVKIRRELAADNPAATGPPRRLADQPRHPLSEVGRPARPWRQRGSRRAPPGAGRRQPRLPARPRHSLTNLGDPLDGGGPSGRPWRRRGSRHLDPAPGRRQPRRPPGPTSPPRWTTSASGLLAGGPPG